MRRSSTFHALGILLILCLPVLVCSTGCAVLYQLAYGDGPKIEAKFAGLKGQRVAVVCVMNLVGVRRRRGLDAPWPTRWDGFCGKVDDIEIVRQDEVSDWMDTNEWDESDFVEIGHGVKADIVLGDRRGLVQRARKQDVAQGTLSPDHDRL